MHNKWSARTEPKGYKCADVRVRNTVTCEDEYGRERTEESSISSMVDGCKTVDISIRQYQCTICGTIGNY